jgi:hypothetical protein
MTRPKLACVDSPEFVVLADRPQPRTNRKAGSRHDAAKESHLPGGGLPRPAGRESAMRIPFSGRATSRLRGEFRVWSVTGSWLVRSKTASNARAATTGDFA